MAKSAAAVALLLALALAGCQSPSAPDAPFTGPVAAGTLAQPANGEASGLGASRRFPGQLWIHADSGAAPELHLLAADGAARGTVRLTGVPNTDWEDLAAFSWRGGGWLCVADVGDNNAVRPSVFLHFLAEPDPAAAGTVAPAFTLEVSYEDGPRDCESVAVDPVEGAVYLLSKREPVPRLYRVPLAPASGPVVARRVGEVPHLPQPTDLQRAVRMPTGAYRANPCALDFAPDGSGAVVLTYGDTLYFPRQTGESWAAALARPPVVLGGHGLPQAEATAFTADGRGILVCSERRPQLLRYDRR
jgi:hypothetical protein